MAPDPETLRTYAAIFDLPRRSHPNGTLHPPTEICRAAAIALRLQADMITLELLNG